MVINDKDRLEMLRDAKRRGLNLYEYARLPNVNVSESTLYRWNRQLGHLLDDEEEEEKVNETPEKPEETTPAIVVDEGKDNGGRQETIITVAAGDPVTTFINEARENHVPTALARTQQKDQKREKIESEAVNVKEKPDLSFWGKFAAGAFGVALAVVGAFGVFGTMKRGKQGTVLTQKQVGEVLSSAKPNPSSNGRSAGIPDFKQPI